MRYSFFWHAALLALCVGLSVACTQEALPPGVVATVNGGQITLRELEARDELRGGGLLFAPNEHVLTVEALRQRYGESLCTLIVEKLMLQELAARKLLPSEAAVRKAENVIRADYAGDEFEKSLQEEYIDLKEWREHLKSRLGLQSFQEHVLLERVPVSDAEIEAYYKANTALFNVPEKWVFLLVAGSEKERVEAARVRALAGQDMPSGPALESRELRVAAARLPEAWKEDMEAVAQGIPTPVRQEEGVYQFLVLKERLSAHTRPLAEVAPDIRRTLAETGLPDALRRWLDEVLPKAKILVSTQLTGNSSALK